jgi:AcrR family transcriptional regulator
MQEGPEREVRGLRAAARANVRAALLSAAQQLSDRSGFEAMTTQDVATLAGVSQRTFFRYFSAKEDVLLDVFDMHNRKICEVIGARPEGEAAEFILRHGLQVYCVMQPEEIAQVRRITSLASTSMSLRKALTLRQVVWEERIIEAFLQREGDGPELRIRHLAAMAMAILSVAFRTTSTSGEHDFERVINSGFALLGVRQEQSFQIREGI